jgi:hypothetical protein
MKINKRKESLGEKERKRQGGTQKNCVRKSVFSYKSIKNKREKKRTRELRKQREVLEGESRL